MKIRNRGTQGVNGNLKQSGSIKIFKKDVEVIIENVMGPK